MPPQFSQLVQLKAGAEEPSVFIAHGIGGDVLEFSGLARNIQSQHPIRGLRAKGADGLDKPLTRIEDMAQYHLQAIKDLQPQGPYLLIGYSLGGLLMLEIAQRLSADGEKIGLLVMLDTYPHRRFLSRRQRLSLTTSLLRHHLSTLRRLPKRRALSYFLDRTGRRLRSAGRDNSDSVRVETTGKSRPTWDSDDLAWKQYNPRFYSGKIRFVKAETSSYFPRNPAAVWAKLANEVEVETTPGDHEGIISTHIESLATILSRYLRETSCSE